MKSSSVGVCASRVVVAVMPTLLFLVMACQSQAAVPSEGGADAVSNAKAVVAAFYAALEGGHFDDAAALLRTPQGQPLSSEEHASIVSSFDHAFGGSGGSGFHVTEVRVASATKLANDLIAQAHASDGYQLTVNVDGSSANHCLPLPLQNLSARVALLDHGWYLLQQIASDYHLVCTR